MIFKEIWNRAFCTKSSIFRHFSFPLYFKNQTWFSFIFPHKTKLEKDVVLYKISHFPEPLFLPIVFWLSSLYGFVLINWYNYTHSVPYLLYKKDWKICDFWPFSGNMFFYVLYFENQNFVVVLSKWCSHRPFLFHISYHRNHKKAWKICDFIQNRPFSTIFRSHFSVLL